MAVTVEEQAALITLDAGDLIVGVGPGAESHFAPLLGSLLWESFPGSEPLFKPHYDKARRTGQPVEFVEFYDGYVTRVRAVPRGADRLELYWELILRLDTLTLEGLMTTLDEALERLDEHSAGVHRDEARKGLRIIEGGA